jgi:hypothetical protein
VQPDRSHFDMALRHFWPFLCEGKKWLRKSICLFRELYSVRSTEPVFGRGRVSSGVCPKSATFCAALGLVLGLFGCTKEKAPQVELLLSPDSSFRFSPAVGYAEYFQLADGSDRLRVTLASYAADCAKFTSVPEEAVSVTLSVASPMGRAIEAREYPVPGSREQSSPGSVSSFVRLHADSREVKSAGKLSLKKIEARLHGLVEGEIRQVPEPNDNQVALTGQFRVRICRVVLDESRKKES